MVVARVDANQKEIVAELRKLGASAVAIHEIGRGCPDLLVGTLGINYLLEVKDGTKPPSRRRLTPDEAKWHQEWAGQVAVVNSVEEAIRLVRGGH